MSEVTIITDSCCDLNSSMARDNGIRIIPTPVHFGEETYRDRDTISLSEFYSRLADGASPTTSQISPADFRSLFSEELEKGNKVIAICFSGELSGIFKSALMAKEELDSDDIAVVDSRSASIGQGLSVMRAAEAAGSGQSWQEILDDIKKDCSHMEHIFAVGSLEMLKRGGRISGGKALIGNILNIKPILHFDEGKILPLSKVRGRSSMIDFLVDEMEKRCDGANNDLVGISHSHSRELAGELKSSVEERFTDVNRIVVGEIGAAIGSHVGSGTVSLFFRGKEPVASPRVVV